MAAPQGLTPRPGPGQSDPVRTGVAPQDDSGQGRSLMVPALAGLVLLLGVALVLAAYLLTGGANADRAAAGAARSASAAMPLPPWSPASTPATRDGRHAAEPEGRPAAGREALPVAAAPERLVIEAAGVDVEILPLTPTEQEVESQSLVPPYTEDGYWLTSYGSPGQGSENTTYITGHSWQGRDAPFDRLSTHTEVGDDITLTTAAGTLEYEVDAITTYNKDTLKASDIWNVVPNRLVLISCYTEDPWGKNVVATASPASGRN